jgi:hypothetical protein
VVISQLSGKIANEFGPRVPMTAGMAMMGSGLFMLALIPVDDSFVVIEAALLVIGCGPRVQPLFRSRAGGAGVGGNAHEHCSHARSRPRV